MNHYKALNVIISQPGSVTFYSNRINRIDYSEIAKSLKITNGTARNLITDCRKDKWILKKGKEEFINPSLIYQGKTKELPKAKKILGLGTSNKSNKKEENKTTNQKIVNKEELFGYALRSKEKPISNTSTTSVSNSKMNQIQEIGKYGKYPFSTDELTSTELNFLDMAYSNCEFLEFTLPETDWNNPVVLSLAEKGSMRNSDNGIYDLKEFKYSLKIFCPQKKAIQMKLIFIRSSRKY